MRKNIIIVSIAMCCSLQAFSQGIIINHTCTKLSQIPVAAILAAKSTLHIAYGHTSHGSQLIDGMNGLITFMNGKGSPTNLYSWNRGGTGGTLDIRDGAMAGDVGYYPDWVNNTRSYLGAPNTATGRGSGTNADINVIIWSWCGQVSGKYSSGTLQSEYIDPMVQLEADYPGIKFVYMTGHLDHWDDANNKAANKMIRDFCVKNNKILYDFADIESYDPDNKYFQFAGDDCGYYASASGNLLGNWATEWQNSHTVNVDWYDCSSAHSQPLNANQKAYAAWWLWARLAGWNQATDVTTAEQVSPSVFVFPNPSNGKYTVTSADAKIHSIEVYNTMGARLFSNGNPGASQTFGIDLSGYPQGTYVIKMVSKENVISKRVVIR